MRLPRLRFTVRWMMVAVAVVAIALTAALAAKRLHTRRMRALELAGYFRVKEDKERGILLLPEYRASLAPLDPGRARAILERREREIERFDDQRRQHERVARYPWLSVDPTPPGRK